MNKWFESKNLANYAKTALIQAQKRIDQVLDIKEEDVIAQSNSILNEKKQTETVNNDFSFSISGSNKAASSSSSSSIKTKDLDEENDSFFSNFLNQSNNKKEKEANIDQSETSISSSDTTHSTTTQKSIQNNDEIEESVTESLGSSVGTINNDDTSNIIPQKSNKSNKQSKQNKTLKQNITIEKQNWIQSFVDSSNDLSNLPQTSNETQHTIEQLQKSEVKQSDQKVQLTETDDKKELLADNESKEVINLENIKKEESTNSNLHSTTDLDFVKIDNNGGSISGNASSSEEGLETCASSDIEVLSLPSNSGDQLLALTNSNFSKSSALPVIPSLVSMAKLASKDINKQNNSNSLSITTNKNVKQIFVKSPPPPSLQQLSKNDSSTSQNKLADTVASDSDKILEARETHILKLNKQNVKLQEDNDNLLNEIEKLKLESNEKLQVMQRTLNELNAKYLEANADREQFKKSGTEIQKEFIELKNLLREKEEQIEQLTQEGLKLSKQELNQSNIIKKLRTKEKETDEVLNILKNDYQKAHKELNDVKSVLEEKEEAETKNIETLKKLEKAALALEKELTSTKSALEDSNEKCKSLENNLQNTFKELAELHKSNAAKENRINEATSSIENQIKEEIQIAVEKERIISNKKQESLKWELESVRQDLTRMEQQYALREDMLRKEIADLQQQLRDSEMRNNELTQNISSATRPLLRQIENLQASHSNQIELLENAERNLIERLKESQANLCELTEKNRQNQETVIDLTQQCKTLEAQVQTLKSEKTRINAEYQLCKTNLETYENERLDKEAQNKAVITSLNKQIETLTKEKKYLDRQLQIEKDKLENDSKKFQTLLNEYTKEKELLMQQQQSKSQIVDSSSNATANSNQILTRYSPIIEKKNTNQFDFSLHNNPSGAINVLEMLQSRLKLKEGEILQLQKEIQNLERIRESMAKEMVSLSNKLETLQEQSKEYPLLQDKFNKLSIEYNALLTMYGEKTEENEELKMDLQDVKEMYKLQIEDLLKRSK